MLPMVGAFSYLAERSTLGSADPRAAPAEVPVGGCDRRRTGVKGALGDTSFAMAG